MPYTQTTGRGTSPLNAAKDLGRLVPKQVNDEIQLAIAQLKAKGISVGVAAGLAVAALLFLSAMLISLLVAGIMGLAEVMPAWLAALAVAGFFLLLILILAAIAVPKAKKAMPLVPEDAIRGLKHDLGVLKEGSSFDVRTLDEPKQKTEEELAEERRKAEEKAAAKEPKPSYDDLQARTRARRAHLAELRDQLTKDKVARAAGKDMVKERLSNLRPGRHKADAAGREPRRSEGESPVL
ncbi:phage holin family protein [Zhihengliuella sp.]|uniref:phage holin family protein n=1 Tax=Zhihengliuella sp. TaxID=1954483 RepID=UPI002812467B|nr:phage holin family protein [Zhihengliuella sp.]